LNEINAFRSTRKTIDKSRNDAVPANAFGGHLRHIDMGVDIPLRIHLAESFDHFLAASHANEPVVDDGDLRDVSIMRAI